MKYTSLVRSKQQILFMKIILALLLLTGISHIVFSQSRPIYFHVSKSSFKLHETDQLSPAIDCNDIFVINGTQKEILVLSATGKVYSIIDQSYKEATDGAVLQLTAKDRGNNIVNFFWIDIKKGEEYGHELIMINEDKSAFFYEGVAKDVF
jgi:hypothetical protein